VSRVGVLGGTFDPPHIGHLTVARDLRDALELDELLLIPAATPPHKPDRPITDTRIRLEMVRAAVADLEGIEASNAEIRRGGTSYTVETLRDIRAGRPDDTIFLIMGVDQFNELSTWERPEEIARLATIVVMAREGESPPETAPGTDIPGRHVPVTRVDVSSTQLRQALASGQLVHDFVPPAVLEIIEAHGLYAGD